MKWIIALQCLLAITLVSCKKEVQHVPPPPTPEGSSPPESSPTSKSASSQVHPDATKRDAIWGKITSGGQPLTGAFITIVKQNEKMDLEGEYQFVFTLDADYYGESPHELLFGKLGYQPQTHSVTIVEAGVELNVDLKPE